MIGPSLGEGGEGGREGPVEVEVSIRNCEKEGLEEKGGRKEETADID